MTPYINPYHFDTASTYPSVSSPADKIGIIAKSVVTFFQKKKQCLLSLPFGHRKKRKATQKKKENIHKIYIVKRAKLLESIITIMQVLYEICLCLCDKSRLFGWQWLWLRFVQMCAFLCVPQTIQHPCQKMIQKNVFNFFLLCF